MKNYIEIIFILDRSGSMESCKSDTIGGYNSFLKEQKDVDGDVKFSLILFDSQFEKIVDRVDIRKVKELTNETYRTRGMTALYDTIGNEIEESIDRLGNTSKEDRPVKTLCVILTDGEENNSRIYSREDIHYHITEMEEKFNWNFLYLGANQNVFDIVDGIGISRSNTMAYTADSDGISNVYMNISRATKTYRTEDEKDLLK